MPKVYHGKRSAFRMTNTKLADWHVLERLRPRWRRTGQVVVWTNGCFDLLHVGHIHSLETARTFGDILVVGLNSDASVRRLKGSSRPIVPANERALILAALECVDYVIEFAEDTPEAALERLQPDVHCKGSDYAPPNGKPIPEASIVRAYGGQIRFLPIVCARSTTSIVQHIRAPERKPR